MGRFIEWKLKKYKHLSWEGDIYCIPNEGKIPLIIVDDIEGCVYRRLAVEGKYRLFYKEEL